MAKRKRGTKAEVELRRRKIATDLSKLKRGRKTAEIQEKYGISEGMVHADISAIRKGQSEVTTRPLINVFDPKLGDNYHRFGNVDEYLVWQMKIGRIMLGLTKTSNEVSAIAQSAFGKSHAKTIRLLREDLLRVENDVLELLTAP